MTAHVPLVEVVSTIRIMAVPQRGYVDHVQMELGRMESLSILKQSLVFVDQGSSRMAME